MTKALYLRAVLGLVIVTTFGCTKPDAESETRTSTTDRATIARACEAEFGTPVDEENGFFEVDRDFVLEVRFDERGHLEQLGVQPKHYFGDMHPEWDTDEDIGELTETQYENLLRRLDSCHARGSLVMPDPSPVVQGMTIRRRDVYEHAVVVTGDVVDSTRPDVAPRAIKYVFVSPTTAESGGLDGPRAEEEALMPCSYFSQPAAGDFATHAGCARVAASGDLEVQPKHLAAATGNEGVGTLLVANRWYYVLPDGESLEVVTYDNGPDHFSEGLVRGLRDGKIGYWNERLEPVVAPRWDWGWPFEGGVALVCSGCERERSPGEEHTSVVGGEWGAIDAQGHEVVSLRGSREEVLDALEADGPAEGWRKGAGGRVPATSTGHFNWPLQLEVLASSRPVLRAVRVEPKVTLRYE